MSNSTPVLVARIKNLGEKDHSLCCVSSNARVSPWINRLELTFQTAELREICEKRSVAVAKLGYAAARELAERLADIEALDTVADLSLLLPEALYDRSPTEKSLSLTGFHVIFVSAHPSPAGATSKTTDWKKTSRMKITSIEPLNG